MTHIETGTRAALAVVTLAAGFFCAAIVLVPMADTGAWPASSLYRLAFQPLCHQLPDRCLDLGFGPLPVCARCSGLYAGGLLGLGIAMINGGRLRPKLRWLIFAAVPSIIDFATGLVGLPSLPNTPRFLLAMIPGALAGLMLATAIADLASTKPRPPDRRKIT